MLQRKIIAITLSFALATSALNISTAEPVDTGTYWFLVDSTPDGRTKKLFNTLTNLLAQNGKVPKNRIHRIEGESATNDEIQSVLNIYSSNPTVIQKAVFLFHGEVSKPSNVNAMHLSTQPYNTVQDSVLNKWLKETNAKQILVIIDGYANDENLGIYYANRETLGSGALNVIHPSDTTERVGNQSFLQAFIEALSSEKTDSDDNRKISIIEIYQYIQDNKSFGKSIFAPTGNVDETVMMLSPAIKVATYPDGAKVMLNETESGVTPQLITEGLQQGTYTLSVSKAGYKTEQPKTTELKLLQGEVLNFNWVLTPISVFGTVTVPSDETTKDTKITIEGTDYVAYVGEDGTFTFQDWNIEKMLIPGKEYTLFAKKGDFFHGSATFTFDGFEDIEQPIKLDKMTWFEIAEFEFSRNNHQQAVIAFQKGIGDTTDFPPLTEDLTSLLLSTFAHAIEESQTIAQLMNVEMDISYIVVTAKLAEAYQQPDVAKEYWKLAKASAQKGSPEAKLAGQRLWQLNPWRNYINIGIIVVVIGVLISAGWTFYRFWQTRKTETDT